MADLPIPTGSVFYCEDLGRDDDILDVIVFPTEELAEAYPAKRMELAEDDDEDRFQIGEFLYATEVPDWSN